jgi:hypothetical protein
MRTLFATAFLLAVVVFVSCKPNQTTDQKQSRPEEKSPSAVTLEHNQEPTETSQKANDNPPEWCAAVKRPEWWLVAAGFGAIIAAIYTLIAIRRQADIVEEQTTATEKSVDAALLNTEAVINSERPWLCIPMGEEFSKIEPPILVERLPGEVRRSYCVVWFKNFGRSPARIVEQKAWLIIGSEPETIPDPKAYESDEDSVKEDYIFPPSETIPVQATFKTDGCITTQEKEDVLKTKVRYLWLCGFCKYTDTFERKSPPIHESRFCYRWISDAISYEDRDIRKNFWIMAGPREYNRAT